MVTKITIEDNFKLLIIKIKTHRNQNHPLSSSSYPQTLFANVLSGKIPSTPLPTQCPFILFTLEFLLKLFVFPLTFITELLVN